MIFVPSGARKTEPKIIKELIKMVRELIGPIAAFHVAAAVRGLPRTRSGKTARKSIADLARNKFVKVNSLTHILRANVFYNTNFFMPMHHALISNLT
jgi:acyl-coenzyme A synthetase/AMP-(fatty) acid ligase